MLVFVSKNRITGEDARMTTIKQEFLIYSFLGWVLESSFQKITKGTFLKPNFLYGPVKPMYGFGGTLLVESYRRNSSRFLYVSLLIPLLVEWCSGKWLDSRYHLKYWDYSKEKIQLGGYICLKFAICWILLAQVLVKWIHPVLDAWIPRIEKNVMWNGLFFVFLLDSTITLWRREYLLKKQKQNHKNQ